MHSRNEKNMCPLRGIKTKTTTYWYGLVFTCIYTTIKWGLWFIFRLGENYALGSFTSFDEATNTATYTGGDVCVIQYAANIARSATVVFLEDPNVTELTITSSEPSICVYVFTVTGLCP